MPFPALERKASNLSLLFLLFLENEKKVKIYPWRLKLEETHSSRNTTSNVDCIKAAFCFSTAVNLPYEQQNQTNKQGNIKS